MKFSTHIGLLLLCSNLPPSILKIIADIFGLQAFWTNPPGFHPSLYDGNGLGSLTCMGMTLQATHGISILRPIQGTGVLPVYSPAGEYWERHGKHIQRMLTGSAGNRTLVNRLIVWRLTD